MEPVLPACLDVMGGFYNFLKLYFLVYFFFFLLAMDPVEFSLDLFTQLNSVLCIQFVYFSSDSDCRNADYHLDKKLQVLHCVYHLSDVISGDNRLRRT